MWKEKDGFDSYEAPAPAMEMVSGDPHLAQNLVDLRHVSNDQPLLKIISNFNSTKLNFNF